MEMFKGLRQPLRYSERDAVAIKVEEIEALLKENGFSFNNGMRY